MATKHRESPAGSTPEGDGLRSAAPTESVPDDPESGAGVGGTMRVVGYERSHRR